jgi:NAD(P)-dependent dehydrogenase (short-subunit alcohol dehydrogenase family)
MAHLPGKTAVITGGSAGVGLVTARRFAAEGAYVFINGRTQAEAVDVARISDVTHEHLQKALPLMNDGGSIILNCSDPNANGNDGYAAVMAALRSLARTWAGELRDRKIRVSVISPDATETPGLDTLAGTLSVVPLARSATAEEVAHAALFLAADLTDETLRGAETTVRSAEKI